MLCLKYKTYVSKVCILSKPISEWTTLEKTTLEDSMYLNLCWDAESSKRSQ
jgi:hypothetical protein